MIKNSEWGAVAYLAQSTYGKNAEVWINPSPIHITGYSGSSADGSGNQYTYSDDIGMQASTTGNQSGIYDMSGNSDELTASYVNNSHANLTTYANSILTAESKYKDVYSVGTPVDDATQYYGFTINKKGDAIYETSETYSSYTAWNYDASVIPNYYNMLFTRGKNSTNASYAGIFAFDMWSGINMGGVSFRPTLVIDAGL
jgi:hypothetical protein